jgi:hypothetical protein
MGGRKKERKNIARIAANDRNQSNRDVRTAQNQYDADLANVRNQEVGDFYSDLSFTGIDKNDLERRSGETFQGQAAQMNIADYAANERASAEGYTAQGTNVGNLQRGAATGLSNVFNNLQVSTAGAEMAAQEADQSLAASQDLAAQAGTGAGGATALAAAAAKSKQGISADIDKQVKANEQLRAQGEQSLQRDMLSQGNLASQFDLGQSQFNVGAQNTASQFGASARNQASQFNAGQTNQRNASMFSAQNQANQFNASQSNAERMAEFGALQNANAANAAATNNALAQNAQGQTQFDLSQAAGLTGVDQAQYGKQMDLMNLSAEQLNNQNASNDALAQLQAAGS